MEQLSIWDRAETARGKALRHPALTPDPEHLLYRKEMHLAPLLPYVVVKDHMRPLTAKAPDVVGMVVTSVTVDVMDHLTRPKGTA